MAIKDAPKTGKRPKKKKQPEPSIKTIKSGVKPRPKPGGGGKKTNRGRVRSAQVNKGKQGNRSSRGKRKGKGPRK